MTDRPDDWAPPAGDPPPPPPPPVTVEPAAVDTTVVRSGGIGARMGAIVVGAALLLAGGAFAASQLGSNGASNPEEAVVDLFDALADEDLLGVLAALDPGERDTLRQPMQDLFDELERLEVVDDSFRLNGVPGIDLEFEDLTFRTEPIIDGLARVYPTGGTATVAVDGAELPVGDFLATTLERFGVDHTGVQESESDEITDDDTFLVARDTGEGWRVSLGYTAAEAARLSAGKPVPATGMAAVGADSPEAAVEGFLRAAADVDVRGMVARLSPNELRALHHYWPVLVDEGTLPSADDLGVTIDLVELDLDADTSGSTARVFVRAIGVDITDEDFVGGVTLADGCATLRGDALEAVEEELDIDGDTICLDDLDELLEEAMADLDDLDMGGFDPGSFQDMFSGDGTAAEFGITATRVDGEWYVAPIRTFADTGNAMLAMVEREHLEAAVDAVEEFFGAFGMFGGGFAGGFDDFGGFDDGYWDEYWDDDDYWDDDAWDDDGYWDDDAWDDDGTWGTSAGGSRTSALVEELVRMVAGDVDVAACVLAQLEATANPNQMAELADAYEYDFEPSPATMDVFYAALDAC
jgi:hypothetical protein